MAERDELLNRVEALERELNEFRAQHHAVGRALVRVEQLRVEAERDAEAIRSEAERVASKVQEQAERAAEAAVRDAEELMNTAKEHLTRLVRGLFERAGAARSLENGSSGSHEAVAAGGVPASVTAVGVSGPSASGSVDVGPQVSADATVAPDSK